MVCKCDYTCSVAIGRRLSSEPYRQREEGTNTIENTLFDAMVKAGAVSKDNSDDPVKVVNINSHGIDYLSQFS